MTEPDGDYDRPATSFSLTSWLTRPLAMREARGWTVAASSGRSQRARRNAATGHSRPGGISFYVLSLIALVGGIWAHAHYDTLSRECQYAAEFGISGGNQCTIATSIAPFAIPVAVIGGIGLVVAGLLDLLARTAGTTKERDAAIAIAAAVAATAEETYTCGNGRCDQFGLPADGATCRSCRQATIWIPADEDSFADAEADDVEDHSAYGDSRQCPNDECAEAGLATDHAFCPSCGTQTIAWQQRTTR